MKTSLSFSQVGNGEDKSGQSVALQLEERGDFSFNFDSRRYFVKGVVPGETAELSLSIDSGPGGAAKRSFGHATVGKVLSKSPQHVASACKFFERCGGCPIMDCSYELQLSLKKQLVLRLLAEQKVPVPSSVEVTSSPQETGYRNKLQMPIRIGEEVEFGFFPPGTRDFTPIPHCVVHTDLATRVAAAVKGALEDICQTPATRILLAKHLAFLLIRVSFKETLALVTLVANKDISETLGGLIPSLESRGDVAGLLLNINSEETNRVIGFAEKLLFGRDHIIESIRGMDFKISSGAFFQINHPVAELLFKEVIAAAELRAEDDLLDLFCGTGVISLIAARHCKSVTGIETFLPAVIDARENASRNSIKNANFLDGKAEDLIGRIPKANVVVVDPPRKGCDQSTLLTIAKLNPRRLVYVSCSAKSFARDAKFLMEQGFRLVKLQLFDLFPNTPHLELLGTFTRAK